MARPASQGRTPIARLQHLGRLGRCLLATSGVALIPLPVAAGAWVPERDRGVLIANAVQVSVDDRDPGLSVEFYGEYGLGHGWAAVLAPSASRGVRAAGIDWASDEVLVGLRKQIWSGPDRAISVQIGAFSPPSTRLANRRDQGTEVRLSFGRNVTRKTWIDGEIATRTCDGGRQGTRFDAAAGIKLAADRQVILKAFGDGDGCSKEILRAQISYLRPISKRLSLELGWRQTLSSPDNRAERGFVVGVWHAF